MLSTPPARTQTEAPSAPVQQPAAITPQETSRLWLWETTKGLAGSVWGVLRFDRYLWNSEQASQAKAKANLLGETAERAVQVRPPSPRHD